MGSRKKVFEHLSSLKITEILYSIICTPILHFVPFFELWSHFRKQSTMAMIFAQAASEPVRPTDKSENVARYQVHFSHPLPSLSKRASLEWFSRPTLQLPSIARRNWADNHLQWRIMLELSLLQQILCLLRQKYPPAAFQLLCACPKLFNRAVNASDPLPNSSRVIRISFIRRTSNVKLLKPWVPWLMEV